MTSFETKHGRPKPPPIMSDGYLNYMNTFCTVNVWKARKAGLWYADTVGSDFCALTHAEAIQYAHKLAYERSQNVHR